MSEGLECNAGEISEEDGEHGVVCFETVTEVVYAQETLELEFCFCDDFVGGGDVLDAVQGVGWTMRCSKPRFEERQESAVVLAAAKMSVSRFGEWRSVSYCSMRWSGEAIECGWRESGRASRQPFSWA